MEIILTGEVGVDITLYDTVAKIEQAKKQNPEIIKVLLTTVGGSSEEGRLIRAYFKNLQIPLQIIAVDYVYSSGITILTGADERYANDDTVEFLMHSPRFHPEYKHHIAGLSDSDAAKLEKDIKAEKDEMAAIYVEAMGIEKDTVIALMEQDMIISAETATGINLIKGVKNNTEIQTTKPDYKIAAKWYINNSHEQKLEKMTKEEIAEIKKTQEETKSFFAKIMDGLKSLGGLKAMEVNSEEGVLIELEGEVLEEGVKILNEVEDGNYTIVMEAGKYKVTIADKVITAVEEIEEEEPTEDVEALKQKIAELESQLSAKKEVENELAAIKKSHEEIKAYENKLRSLTAKYTKEDGEFNFKGKEEAKPKPETMSETIKAWRESKTKTN